MPRPSLKKRKDGRYACRYGRLFFYGSTAQEAYAARDQYKREQEQGLQRADTVAGYAEKWLPIHKASVSRPTYNSYAKHLRNLSDILGDSLMKDVTPSDIKAVYATCYIGRSESSIHKAKIIFTALWDAAIEDGAASYNPCRSKQAAPHRGSRGTHRVLTAWEDQLLLETQSPLRLAILVMRYAGLRRGEALALNIDRDVDFTNRTITVREAVRYDSNQPILAKPKTAAGKRVVPLFDILADALRDRHGLLAPSASGGLMTETAFRCAWQSYRNAMERKLNGTQKRWYGRTKEQQKKKAEGTLPPWIEFTVRPHDLRHSFCTMLRDAGVEMKLAMQWMGHADEKMILRIYDHVTDNRVESAVQQVENQLHVVAPVVKIQEKPAKLILNGYKDAGC